MIEKQFAVIPAIPAVIPAIPFVIPAIPFVIPANSVRHSGESRNPVKHWAAGACPGMS